MRKDSFEVAQEKIHDFLKNDDLKAYTTFDISNILESNRENWKIANYRNSKHFIKFLDNTKILKLVKLKHQTSSQIKQILIKPDSNNLNIALTIKKDGYLCNYSAMFIHQLTLQIPKVIYTSYSKSHTTNSTSELTQKAIDSAFSKPQRITSDVYKSETDNTRYYFIQKAYKENNIGIISDNNLRYTDLERTLIDITIRPAYSGGVFEVLEAYEKAKNNLNIKKLLNYLEELDYVYPYHQLIGFYMDKAGYENKTLKLLLNHTSEFNFYLTYNISNKEFNEKWKIFYPKGF